MRNFIVVGNKAITSPNFSLNGLHSSGGRLDILCRCVNSAFFLSHDIRRDVTLWLILLGGPDPPITIRFEGERLKHLNPDERNIASLIKKALDRKGEEGVEVESTPGIFVRRGDLKDALSDEGDIFYLREDGIDITKMDLEFEEPTFVLGDHLGLSIEYEELLKSLGAEKVCVGPVSLHADHCIIVVHNRLDINELDRNCN
ncbi:MAG: tRNA (pseudouridine(54)-N(1))-methyltransferase TrmY [Halobacteriota archaeon]|nr:tRNA (pseudouridine(54)-N(1))-methyltransferase TrmY [Halobacteriota archaeon]